MKNKIPILFFILCLLAANAPLFAQKPDFTGTWTLNLEKSSLESRSEGFTGSVFIIRQEGDIVKLTRYHFYGEKKNKLSFKMIADGKTRSVKILFKGKLEWQGDNLVSTLWRKHFSNIVTYHFGSNPQEFIADEVFKGYPKDHHNIWVFDKDTSNQDNF